MKKFFAVILCCAMVFSSVLPIFGASLHAEDAADKLYAYGLFSGTGVDESGKPVYSLDAPLNRQEAITIVLNLLGLAHEAKQTVSPMPFEDVDAWAQPFVGYAYAKGITAGLSETEYGAARRVTAAEYLSFLLGSLGYRADRDFVWREATVLSDHLGITYGHLADGQALTRGDAVILAERVLYAKMPESGLTLSEHYLGTLFSEKLLLPTEVHQSEYAFDLSNVPTYAGSPYIVLNGNIPSFTEEDLSYLAFERYGALDSLGRCGEAFACLGIELMPTAPRGSIGQIKPSGWQTVRYDDLIADKYLYNRCHLIGFQLTAEDANECNLITGTRYMNVAGMEPFESALAAYIKKTGNHVLYRVTPVFSGSDLVATGVHVEALSEEDAGEGIQCNLFFYNVQPGIEIDYLTGDSRRAVQSGESVEEPVVTREPGQQAQEYVYVVNINPSSHKIHLPWCGSVQRMNESNKWYCDWSLQQLLDAGYSRCHNCNP